MIGELITSDLFFGLLAGGIFGFSLGALIMRWVITGKFIFED